MSKLHCPLNVTICHWKFLKCQSGGEFSHYFQLEILARQEDVVLRGCQCHTCLKLFQLFWKREAQPPFPQKFPQSDEDPVNPGSECTFLGGRPSDSNEWNAEKKSWKCNLQVSSKSKFCKQKAGKESNTRMILAVKYNWNLNCLHHCIMCCLYSFVFPRSKAVGHIIKSDIYHTM